MAAGNVHTLQAALLLLPERPGEVHCCAISGTPIPALLRGLLSKNGASQFALCPLPSHKQWERCLRLSKNRGRHHFGRFSRPESLLLHLQGKLFSHPPGQLLWELQVLMRVAWTILADTSWAWASFLTLSGQSFSSSAVNAYLCILVKAWSW